MKKMQGPITDLMQQLSPQDSNEGLSNDDMDVLEDSVATFQNSEVLQREQHIFSLYKHVTATVRHEICRRNMDLGWALTECANASDEQTAQARQKADEKHALGQIGDYDPIRERADDFLSKVFEGAVLPSSYHMAVMFENFLSHAKRIGVFAGAPSDEAFDPRTESPRSRAISALVL